MSNTAGHIAELISAKGPLTGLQLKQEIDIDSYVLWKTCQLSGHLQTERVGTEYLRLDRRIDGFARLSPSILRQFFTYTVVGLKREPDALARRVAEVTSRVKAISRAKQDLAYAMVSRIAEELTDEVRENHAVCFIIAGDIVYDMAHDVPRPERSTGKLVKGSDIDLVVVVDDEMPDHTVKQIDQMIYREKYRLLVSPAVNEEVDYIVKRVGRVREQAAFDTFRHMVACKILREGTFLFGSEPLFRAIHAILEEHGVLKKLDELEHSARVFRKNAEEALLHRTPAEMAADGMYLFYPAEESEEFE